LQALLKMTKRDIKKWLKKVVKKWSRFQRPI
jgi:hypothetical protein